MFGGRSKAGAIVALLIIASVLAIAIGPGPVEAANPAAGDPRVTDGTTTLTRALLSATADIPRISGLKDNVFTATYVASGAQAVPCTMAVLRYTLDGSNPVATSPGRDMACTGTSPNPQSSTFQGTLTPADLAPAPINALVKFQIEYPQAPTPTPDDNSGAFFSYRLDKTPAFLSSRTPANITGSSIPDAVTTERKPNIAFVLTDDPREARLDLSSMQVMVDNVDLRDAFDCTPSAGEFSIACVLGYEHLSQGFDFGEGRHEVIVRGRDLGNNAFNESRTTFGFRVDLTPPVVRNVTAAPNVFVSSGGLPTTSRGAFVTVKANVEDLNINTNAASAVAYLINSTRNLESATGTNLAFNATSGKWESALVQVPISWPAEQFAVRAKVVGFDQAARSTTAVSISDQFQLDPDLPVIVETPVGPFIRDVATQVKIKATDNSTGVDPAQVRIRVDNVTGGYKTAPTGVNRIDNNTFEANMSRVGSTDDYVFTIPAPTPGSVITYIVSVRDRAGGPAATPQRTLIVDLTGPVMFEADAKEFRSRAPHRFSFIAADSGAGVDTTSGKIFTSTGGSFTSTPLVFDATTGELVANVTIPVTDGATVRYYAEVKDTLGNVGGFRNQSNAARTVVDLLAPTVTSVTSPGTTSAEPTFRVTWAATDGLSGIDYYRLEARVNDGTPTAWTAVANQTEDTGIDFCGEGGHTYEFRVSATDRAGNTANMPANPQARTVLEGPGCPESTAVTILSPASGSTIDARSVSTFNLRWTASASRSFTPSADLVISVFFSPDGRFWHPLANGIENTGTYPVKVRELPTCNACKFQVAAATLTGVTGNGTSGSFRLVGGSTTADLDGNGLADAWEIRYAGEVRKLTSGEDPDKDGLSNLDESRLGTDPQNRDTDGDGASDRAESRAGTDPLSNSSVPSASEARTDEYTNWYWTVPGMFLALTIFFFVGLARRW